MNEIAVLNVLLYNQLIGTLTRLPGDKNQFDFTQDYIDNPQRPILSLSFKDAFGELMPSLKPTQTSVPPFFANLLPEGSMRDYLAKRAEVNPKRDFFLLWILGRDLPGAISIQPTDDEDWPTEAATEIPSVNQGEGKEVVLRFSLAGVHLKFSAIKEARGGLTIPADGVGGSWIIKLPATGFNGVPENEYVMMALAKSIGIEVPETMLIPIKNIGGLPHGIDSVGEYAFAIRRFDRKVGGKKIHMEDFAQVFNVYPEKKYEQASYRNIAEVIWIETGEEGIKEFMRRLVFNALIGNADMHLKNWSLIYPDKLKPSLAPAYDFVSTIPYLPDNKLALNFVDSKEFNTLTKSQFQRFAAKAGLPEMIIWDTAQETVQAFSEQWRLIDEYQLNPDIKKAIDLHLKKIPLWKNF